MKAIEQAEKIYRICVSAAKERRTIFYREVLDKLGYGENVGGHAIRFGLELAWIACAHQKLPILTAIVVNQTTGAPSDGYSVENWEKDAKAVFSASDWPESDKIDWGHIWANRVALSEQYGTRGYWRKE